MKRYDTRNTLLPLALSSLAINATALTVEEPVVSVVSNEGSIVITSPDDDVKTLGSVDFIIDWVAQNDSIKELEIRRAGLTLSNGQAIDVFDYDENHDIIVVGRAPVHHISIADVVMANNGRDVIVSFYNDHNDVIAPEGSAINVFRLSDHKPLHFQYKPLRHPASSHIPVDLLIDNSGSMEDHMVSVLDNATHFLAALPIFTRCQLITFNSEVAYLTPRDLNQLVDCPESAWYLNKGIETGGATALLQALRESIESGLPGQLKLTIVVTDGHDTVGNVDKAFISTLKASRRQSKVLVFWAGSYDAEHLQGLADWEFVSRQNLKDELARFFRTIEITVNGLQTIHLPE